MKNMALNHMVAPHLDAESFCALTARLGGSALEVRMDTAASMPGEPVAIDHISAFSKAAQRHGLRIACLSELSAFDIWNGSRSEQAKLLAEYAVGANIPAICLIPSNDGAVEQKSERMARLRAAMLGVRPILSDNGLMGYIEPLGFETASLRLKGEIVEMIVELDLSAHFKLIHDTFHHALVGGGPLFPDHTALVHISGVEDQCVDLEHMRDGNRGLVTEHDRLGTIAQIKALKDAGYGGPISFEPFAKAVQQADDLEAQLSRSLHFIDNQLQLLAA